ncbi:hypothetical protein ABI_47580 [Asticcacaulis biprosthecium C19]|uniref:S1/P1 Nuclease family protein n=1 Tax=Asticcacaulis biprosthecium C19 TaxID=715226 RepID=F4QUB0_9CAUL|nr:hypothetical protein [Asticcacaulis biprosthecium]EGF89410.1 hypothetical protein ABI_47580 [Asticcacaulis biprosthecium C19]
MKLKVVKLKSLLLSVVAGVAIATAALAWGSAGHRFIGEEAIRALPDYTPAFLRTPEAIADVGEYANEPDRWRDSGFVHDSERNAAHFIDLDDEGKTLAGQTLAELPRTRADFEITLNEKGQKIWKSGYLPYAMVDGYQQVVKDFAYWRVLNLLETRETDKAKKAWYRADRIRRESLIKRDIGVLAHYVGDTTQPLHMSIHYNGWGEEFPNPNGYTLEKIHVPLENAFVDANISAADVRASMAPYEPCTDGPEKCFAKRMMKSHALVVPLYELEKAGGFKPGDPRGRDFMKQQLGQGASDLRDVILDAWRDSKTMAVGWPKATYDDFVGGKVADPYLTLHGGAG